MLDSFQIAFCCLQVALLRICWQCLDNRGRRAEALTQNFLYEFCLSCSIQKGFSFPEGHSVFIVAATFQWSGQKLGSKAYVVC